LDQTFRLLLSHGANVYAENDDHLTPLDIARVKGYNNVVRAIEEHMCYLLWACTIIWEVELQVTIKKLDPMPQAIIPLWKSKIDIKFHQADPLLAVFDQSSSKRLVIKFAPIIVGDKQQLLDFYNACRGISQV
ncbi:hypothetical protein V2J09_003094, partial [Rumex salicifolius]